MAWLTRFDGTGFFTLASDISAFSSLGWEIRFEMVAPANGVANRFHKLLGNDASNNDSVQIVDEGLTPANNRIALRLNGVPIDLNCPNNSFQELKRYRITQDGTDIRLYIDDVQVGSPVVSTAAFGGSLNRIGRNNAAGRPAYDLVNVEIDKQGVAAHAWAAPQDGLGSTMTDTVGGNTATESGFTNPSPFAEFTPVARLLSADAKTTGINLVSGTTYNFTYENADNIVMTLDQSGDRAKSMTLTVVDNADGTGTFTLPALGDVTGHVDFGTAVTLTMATDTNSDTLPVDGVEPNSPYQDVTLALVNTGNESVTGTWTEQPVVGDQGIYDNNFTTWNSDNTFTIDTVAETWTYEAYIIDSNGMQAFQWSDDLIEEPTSGIPLASRTPDWKLASYLRSTESLEGSTNDVIFKWLEGQGYTGTLNDMWIQYWEAQGYTGSYPDKRYKWLKM